MARRLLEVLGLQPVRREARRCEGLIVKTSSLAATSWEELTFAGP